MASYKAGDRVEVRLKNGKTFEGTILPQEGETLSLKLKSGYNMGIKQDNIDSVTVLDALSEKETVAPSTVTQSKDLPHIAILHTGGTIASKVDYETGGVVARFTPEELLALFPEMKDMAQVTSRLVANMSSDDMRFGHYNLLLKEIEAEVKNGVKGIVVTHGTDTLHYTSAALSFALENCPVPVLLVGAQRSSDRGSSDASHNLLSAVSFLVNTNFVGVGVCMHKTMDDDVCGIFPGTNCRKMHSSRRDAFKPINATLVGEATTTDAKLFVECEKPTGEFSVKPFKPDVKTALLKIYTNMHACQIDVLSSFDGVVLEGTGLGHAPISAFNDEAAENAQVFESLKKLNESGTVLAMSTQTIFGRVDMNVYAPGRTIQEECGMLGNFCDMSPETAYIKLSWLLSNYSKEEACELYGKNLRGEISDASSTQGFNL